MRWSVKLIPRFRLTIGTKLVGLIGVLLIGSAISLTYLSTHLYIEYSTVQIQKANSESAASISLQIHELFRAMNEKARVLGAMLLQDFGHAQVKERIVEEFFSKDNDFLGVFIYRQESNGTITRVTQTLSREWALMGDPTGEKAWSSVASNKDFELAEVFRGEVRLAALSIADGTVSLFSAIPFISGSAPNMFSHILVYVIKQNKIVRAFKEVDGITSFMVDAKGKLLAHTRLPATGEDFSRVGIVQELLKGKASNYHNNHQMSYMDPQSSDLMLGAFRRVGFGGLTVVAEVEQKEALSAAEQIKYRSVLVALIVLCLAFLSGYVYSGSISRPIRQLVEVSKRISAGDFNINIKPKGQDEVAVLSLAFNEMARGLEERDKVKQTFNKFHNKEIADKLLSGEVKLGGEQREAAIFFSDIRGFTAMSEAMEPEAVVELLNEYMTRMVSIIRSHHGVVDKYVGDAIMALWGVPFSSGNDANQAVMACLEMRQGLVELNELRQSRGQVPIRIGIGLNIGPVIAGNIGSDEKMEYTVIGDSVNIASRIESMTKEFGTDLLISKSVYESVKDRFVVETCGSSKVKGKKTSVNVYKVLGYINPEGKQVIIQTPYSSYTPEKSEKTVHDLDFSSSMEIPVFTPNHETPSPPPFPLVTGDAPSPFSSAGAAAQPPVFHAPPGPVPPPLVRAPELEAPSIEPSNRSELDFEPPAAKELNLETTGVNLRANELGPKEIIPKAEMTSSFSAPPPFAGDGTTKSSEATVALLEPIEPKEPTLTITKIAAPTGRVEVSVPESMGSAAVSQPPQSVHPEKPAQQPLTAELVELPIIEIKEVQEEKLTLVPEPKKETSLTPEMGFGIEPPTHEVTIPVLEVVEKPGRKAG